MSFPDFIRLLLAALGLYVSLGFLFAAVFHWRGLSRLDTAARDAGPGFRLLITPGLVILWPWILHRWIRIRRGFETLAEPRPSPTPRRLRRNHCLAWQALAIVLPLVLAAALAWRPAPPSSHLPPGVVQGPDQPATSGPNAPHP